MSDYFIFILKMDMNILSNILYKDYFLFYLKELLKILEVYVIFFDIFDFEWGMMVWIFVDFWMFLFNFDIVVIV